MITEISVYVNISSANWDAMSWRRIISSCAFNLSIRYFWAFWRLSDFLNLRKSLVSKLYCVATLSEHFLR